MRDPLAGADYRDLGILRNARQRQDRNLPCAGGKAGIGGGGEGRARCHHVVDQEDMTALQPVAAARMGGQRAGKVGVTLVPALAVLAGGGALADQKVRAMIESRDLGKRPRKKRRLVVAPAQEPPPVKGHRRQHHARFEDRGRGARQPARHRPHQVKPVGVFQGKDHVAAPSLVEKRRPTPLPRPGECQAIVAKFGAPLVLARKGRAAVVADEAADEGGLAPAVAAQAEVRRDLRPASDAGGWKNRPEHTFYCHPLPLWSPAMPDPAPLTDRTALARQRARARAQGADLFLHRAAADEIEERLAEVNRWFTAPAVVTGFADFWRERLQSRLPGARVVGDDEVLALTPGTHDLVIHALALHWANDPVGQIIQSARALKPDGLFLAVLPGGRTLHELRACLAEAEIRLTGGLSPRVLPTGEIRDLGGLLSRAGLALPVADAVTLTASYRDLGHLAADLRAMGEGNALAARTRRPARRALFAEASRIYRDTYPADGGRIAATFDLIFLTGWAPHPDQQKPLRPGSAVARLADALNPGVARTGE